MEETDSREVREYAMFISEGLAKEESMHQFLIEQAIKQHNIEVLRWEVRESNAHIVTGTKIYALVWYGYEKN